MSRAHRDCTVLKPSCPTRRSSGLLRHGPGKFECGIARGDVGTSDAVVEIGANGLCLLETHGNLFRFRRKSLDCLSRIVSKGAFASLVFLKASGLRFKVRAALDQRGLFAAKEIGRAHV